MTEVLGAASAAAGLLEVAIRTVKRVRTANERQHSLIQVLDKHTREMNKVKALVHMIEDEDSLQTANVEEDLVGLHAVIQDIVKLLKMLDPKNKGTARQLAHQLVHGSSDEKTLADLMQDLDRTKANICLRIQLANVGLIRSVGDVVLANAEAINRIDRLLVDVIGEGRGLKLAKLLQDRIPQEDGLVSISKAEIASLSGEVTGVADKPSEAGPTSSQDSGTLDRIILRNSSRDMAIQVLGPIGEDIWMKLRVRIEDNNASGTSIQVPYAISLDALKFLVEAQDKRIDKQIAQRSRDINR